jgi:hypothetical protein
MFYAYAQRRRGIKVPSGIDMARRDLAGRSLNRPVSKLLCVNFQDRILLYSHATGGDYLSKEEWSDRAQRQKSGPQEFTPSIGLEEARRIHVRTRMVKPATSPDVAAQEPTARPRANRANARPKATESTGGATESRGGQLRVWFGASRPRALPERPQIDSHQWPTEVLGPIASDIGCSRQLSRGGTI